MSSRPVGALALTVAAALAVGVLAAPAAGATDTAVDEPRIAAVLPDPVAQDDAGEWVALAVPPGTPLSRYRLRDGEGSVRLPNVTASGRVTLSAEPDAVARDRPVYPLGTGLQLANGGERVALVRDGAVVDSVEYADAPEGSRLIDGEWRPLGATDRPIVTGGAGTVRAFVLPDAPDVAVEFLRGADRRLLLAGYTLGSDRVVEALVAAAGRGVTVRVVVDGDPVGGLTRRSARLLDRLAAGGVEVRVLGGRYTRYAFHHAKYAVADDRALVTTENWKPAGTGGASSRGWGVVTPQPRIVRGLVTTFRADAGWRAARPWREFRHGRSFEPANATDGGYPAVFEPDRVAVNRSRLLVAPDNAERAVVGLLDNATDSVVVEQAGIGSRGQPFVQATLDAARRGVSVRVLLSGAWYAREENRRIVEWLNGQAEREGLPLAARLGAPRGQFEKIHAKGVIVDGDQVLLGSLNWNNSRYLLVDGRK